MRLTFQQWNQTVAASLLVFAEIEENEENEEHEVHEEDEDRRPNQRVAGPACHL